MKSVLFDVQCTDGKVKINKLIFVIRLALKFNKRFNVNNVLNVIRGITV